MIIFKTNGYLKYFLLIISLLSIFGCTSNSNKIYFSDCFVQMNNNYYNATVAKINNTCVDSINKNYWRSECEAFGRIIDSLIAVSNSNYFSKNIEYVESLLPKEVIRDYNISATIKNTNNNIDFADYKVFLSSIKVIYSQYCYEELAFSVLPFNGIYFISVPNRNNKEKSFYNVYCSVFSTECESSLILNDDTIAFDKNSMSFLVNFEKKNLSHDKEYEGKLKYINLDGKSKVVSVFVKFQK